MDYVFSLYKGTGTIFSAVPSLFMLYFRDCFIFVIIVTRIIIFVTIILFTIILPGTTNDVGKRLLQIIAIHHQTSFLIKVT